MLDNQIVLVLYYIELRQAVLNQIFEIFREKIIAIEFAIN